MIQAAVQTFFHRYIAPFKLPVLEKTDDSIESFTTHIAEATSFIQDMANPPFQVCVIFYRLAYTCPRTPVGVRAYRWT